MKYKLNGKINQLKTTLVNKFNGKKHSKGSWLGSERLLGGKTTTKGKQFKGKTTSKDAKYRLKGNTN